jgi:hypothetical protein
MKRLSTGPNIIGLAFLPFRFSFDSWNTVVVTKQAPSKKPVDWEVVTMITGSK